VRAQRSPRLVLASASAARRNLLSAAGLEFDIVPADIDEAAVKREAQSGGLSAESTALLLADGKASAIGGRYPDALVLGADQILQCEGAWFDKPATVAAAREQLLALRGRTHTLATAAVCHENGQRVWHAVVTPRLRMRVFSDRFLDGYLAAEGESVTNTVGSYRLEGRGAQLFDAIEGDHWAILGLPLLSMLGFLRRAGVTGD
jgi:septum formation protein